MRRTKIRAALSSLLLLVLLAGCGGGGGSASGVFSGGDGGGGGGGSTGSVELTLSVKGTAAQVSVRYIVAGSSTSVSSASLPWSTVVSAQSGQTVSLSATNLTNLGTVTVEISGSGIVPQSNTTSANFGTATVSFGCC